MDTTSENQIEFMNGIIKWLREASNASETEAYNFALVVWQHKEWLKKYLA